MRKEIGGRNGWSVEWNEPRVIEVIVKIQKTSRGMGSGRVGVVFGGRGGRWG